MIHKQVRIRVSDNLYEILHKFCKEYHVPMAYLCRMAIINYLSKKGAFSKEWK